MNRMASRDEMAITQQWYQRLFESTVPMSFSYGGKSLYGLLPSFEVTEEMHVSESADHCVRRYYDAATHLSVTVEIKKYIGFPCIEWVARLKNEGLADMPVIEDLQALSMEWVAEESLCGPVENPVVRYAGGTRAKLDDFALMEHEMQPDGVFELSSKGGKSSIDQMPFYNLHWGGQGVIAMIGWSGQWAARLARSGGGKTVSLAAGLIRTRFTLHPGEEVRTPSIALLFWTGSITRSHNLLRRFLAGHHSPQPGDKPVKMPVSCPSWGGMQTKNHLRSIALIQKTGIPYTNYWIDAGWFGPPHDTEEYQNFETEDWFGLVGDWRVNTTIHPGGMKAVSDAAQAAGMTFLLWMEPERAVLGTPVTLEHPEWLVPLPPAAPRYDVGKYKAVESMLVNLGIPEARRWITDFVSERIANDGVDIYRQDMNTTLAKYWDSVDTPDRVGIAEMKYIEGLYAFIDELLARHPGLLVDNCSGGGSRLDIEMISRSVCLHRTDYVCWPGANPRAVQAQGLDIMHWIPHSCSGGGCPAGDTYRFRSDMSGGVNLSLVTVNAAGDGSVAIPEDCDGQWHSKMLKEHELIQDLFSCDFYPLTDTNLSAMNWHAYELNSPERGLGALIAFRREESPFSTACFPLMGLEEGAQYEMVNIDTGEMYYRSGGDLADAGFELAISGRRESRIVTYRKIVS